MGRGQTMLELFRVLLGLAWWASVILVPAQLALALVRASTGNAEAGWGNVGVTVMLPDPAPGVGLAYGTVELAALPTGHAVIVAVLRLAIIAVWLPALWQLRRITRHMVDQPFDQVIVRRMQLVGPLVALAGVVTAALTSASSWIAAGSGPVPGAQPAITVQVGLWALVAAAVFVLFTEILRIGTRQREDNDLTI